MIRLLAALAALAVASSAAAAPSETPTRPLVEVLAGARPLAATTVEGMERAELAVGGSGARLTLRLAATFPEFESFGMVMDPEVPLDRLSEPERMSVSVRYADGRVDEAVPYDEAAGAHGLVRGIGTYAIPLDPEAEVASVAIVDRMTTAAFAVLAAEVGGGPVEPAITPPWYPAVEPVAEAEATFGFDTTRGLRWGQIVSTMLPANVDLTGQPVFSIELDDGTTVGSDAWTLDREWTAGTTRNHVLTWAGRPGVQLEATFSVTRNGPAEAELALAIVNRGEESILGDLRFPVMQDLKLGAAESPWGFASRTGGVVHPGPFAFRDGTGERHPLQVDAFFHPDAGVTLALMPRDRTGGFRYYEMALDADGGDYALAYPTDRLEPAGVWNPAPVVLEVLPGDWRAALAAYTDWTDTWRQPTAAHAAPWFRRVFDVLSDSPVTWRSSRGTDAMLDFGRVIDAQVRDIAIVPDVYHVFDWAKTDEFGHWGDYDNFQSVGGPGRFSEALAAVREKDVKTSVYLDGYLVTDRARRPSEEDRTRWGILREDGEPKTGFGDARAMNLNEPGWRRHLVETYTRAYHSLRPDAMYCDEVGQTLDKYTHHPGDGSRVRMAAGEADLLRELREALPVDLPLWTEFTPADAASQHTNGSFSYNALIGHFGNEEFWSSEAGPVPSYQSLAPHFVNLNRFAFPEFKSFHLLSYPHTRNGNWTLYKVPFFNGDGYYQPVREAEYFDDGYRAFITKALGILQENAGVFASDDAQPLVPTRIPGVYANRFASDDGATVIYTLYNANHHTVRGPMLGVAETPRGIENLWSDAAVEEMAGPDGRTLSLELGPRALGCLRLSNAGP